MICIYHTSSTNRDWAEGKDGRPRRAGGDCGLLWFCSKLSNKIKKHQLLCPEKSRGNSEMENRAPQPQKNKINKRGIEAERNGICTYLNIISFAIDNGWPGNGDAIKPAGSKRGQRSVRVCVCDVYSVTAEGGQRFSIRFDLSIVCNEAKRKEKINKKCKFIC